MTLSSPYEDDDGKWWVDDDGRAIRFDTEAEAWAFHKQREQDVRVERVSEYLRKQRFEATPLHHPENLKKPLPKVPEGTMPSPPPLTLEEKRDAYQDMAATEIARLEYEEAVGGKIPFSYKVKIGSIGAIISLVVGLGLKFAGCV